MQCYLCAEEARERCPRCERPFCFAHGRKFCRDCTALFARPWPGSTAMGLPSAPLFWGAVAALVVAVLAGVFFLFREPVAWPVAAAVVEKEVPKDLLPTTPTEAPRGLLIASPTPQPSPAAEQTPRPSPQASPTPEPTATPTPTEVAFINYEVEDGDNLWDIAARFGVTVDDLLEYNDLEDPDSLSIGQVLVIPR